MADIRGSRARVKNASVNKTVPSNTFDKFTAEEAKVEEKYCLLIIYTVYIYIFVYTYVYAYRYMARINDHLHVDLLEFRHKQYLTKHIKMIIGNETIRLVHSCCLFRQVKTQ